MTATIPYDISRVLQDKVIDATDGSAEETIKRISMGDESAMHQFYQRYRADVYQLALSRLKNTMHAEEVLNDVMLDVWLYAWRYVPRGKLKNWLLTVTHNKIVDRLRKEIRYQNAQWTTPINKAVPETPQECVEKSEISKVVRDTIGALSCNHQAVIKLSFYEELTYRDIARILNCPENTVKTRMYYAKQIIERKIAARLEG